MLTPEQWNQIEKQANKLYNNLELEIIQEIAERIANVGYANTVVLNNTLIAQEMGMLYQDIINQVAQYNNSTEIEIERIFEEAGISSLKYDDNIYRLAGLNPTALKQSKSMWQLLTATALKTHNNLSNLTMTTANTSQTQFYNAMNKAYMEVSIGVKSYSQSIIDTIKEISNQGAYVQYPSGQHRSIESAVRTNIITSVNQTCGKLQLMRAEELEWDLMELTAHSGARPAHANWQGKIVSRSGQKGYLSLDDIGYGTATGFKGINCYHDWRPYYKGSTKTYTDKELKEMANETVIYNGKKISKYDASQIQRKMERQIRQDKKNIAGFQGILTSNIKDAKLIEDTRSQLLNAQNKLKQHNSIFNDFTEQTKFRKDYTRLIVGQQNTNKNNILEQPKKTIKSAKTFKVQPKYKNLSEDEYFELQEKHRKNIKEEVRNSIYVTDWDNMQTLNKYGYINSNYSRHINYIRRTGDTNAFTQKEIKEFNNTISNLETAIKNNKIDKNIQTTRYLDIEWFEDKLDKKTYKEIKYMKKFDKLKELKGKEILDNQFISGSLQEEFNVYSDRKVRMIIQADKGTNAFITENKMEREIIFDSSKLLIKEISISDNNIIEVIVKIIKGD